MMLMLVEDKLMSLVAPGSKLCHNSGNSLHISVTSLLRGNSSFSRCLLVAQPLKKLVILYAKYILKLDIGWELV